MPFEDELARQLGEIEAAGLLRTPPVVEAAQGPTVVIDGREVLCLCSNNYLGLAGHPALVQALREGASEVGSGAGASRLVSGTMTTHREAERALAAFVGTADARLFSSGYAANVGAISALAGPDDLILSDALNHASLIDGCRLSRARVEIFPHSDTDAATRILRDSRAKSRRAFVITEAMFSMDGDRAPVRALRELCDRHDAALFVDEAHSIGVLGPEGRGLCAAENIRADVLVGTLGKSFGLAGAFIAGSEALTRVLEHRARSYVFSTAIQPALAHATLAAIELVRSADDARRTLVAHADEIRKSLRLDGRDAIIPVIIGDPESTMKLSRRLLDAGVFVQAIRPPTVPDRTSRLRIVPMATHSRAQITSACATLAAIIAP